MRRTLVRSWADQDCGAGLLQRSSRAALLVASDAEEEIAGGVGQHHPAGAVSVTSICNFASTELNRPMDLVIALAIGWCEVKVDATVARLELVDFDEQQLVTG